MLKMLKNSLLGVFKAVEMQNYITIKLAVVENVVKAKISITFGSKSREVESREK